MLGFLQEHLMLTEENLELELSYEVNILYVQFLNRNFIQDHILIEDPLNMSALTFLLIFVRILNFQFLKVVWFTSFFGVYLSPAS